MNSTAQLISVISIFFLSFFARCNTERGSYIWILSSSVNLFRQEFWTVFPFPKNDNTLQRRVLQYITGLYISVCDNNAHIIIPFTIHIILLKLASYRSQPMDWLRKPTDWFLNVTKFYRQVIFEHSIIDVWSILK